MPFNTDVKDKPSSVTQLVAAMAALGLYHGANTPAEHAAEARRLGGENAYRVRLVNALLGHASSCKALYRYMDLGHRCSWPKVVGHCLNPNGGSQAFLQGEATGLRDLGALRAAHRCPRAVSTVGDRA